MLFASAAALALLAGCATMPANDTAPTPDNTAAVAPPAPTLDEVAFQVSLTDASLQSPANVYNGLFPINNRNAKLQWRDRTQKRQLKVVSLMSQASYDKYYKGVTHGVTTGVYSWVTLAPQIQEFCKATGLTGEPLKTRLKERLGLVPTNAYDMFVEFWVDRSDLFRPCPDPETNDTSCNVAFGQKNGMPVNPTVKGVDDYIGWFNDTYTASYSPGGAPWTRLGYTYDWNPDTPKYGASEYLMTKGTAWELVDAANTDAYCTP
jgi:hypothetical protein